MSGLRYETKNAYETLVAALESAGNQADCGSIKLGKPPHEWFKRIDDTSHNFECFLHLKDWKFRGGSRKRLSILIHASENLNRQGSGIFCLVKSTVQVCYFDIEDQKATPLQSLHFDYDPNQKGHPLFHAQVTHKPLYPPDNQTEPLGFDFQIEPGSQVAFRDARIPTSDMTFPSVLLCLASDHLGAHFRSFLERFQQIQTKIPCSSFDSIRESMSRDPSHFRSSHWFAHG